MVSAFAARTAAWRLSATRTRSALSFSAQLDVLRCEVPGAVQLAACTMLALCLACSPRRSGTEQPRRALKQAGIPNAGSRSAPSGTGTALACPVRAHADEFDSALALVCTQAAVHCQQVAQIHELGVPADAANEAYRVADTLLQRTAASGLSCTDFRSKPRPPASKLEVRSPKLGRIFFSPVGAPAGLRWEDEAAGRMWSGRQLCGGAGGALGSGVRFGGY